jgi:DNA-binding response OmpR family regulator
MKKILILDDDKDSLEILSFFLKETGYDLQTSFHGETVFEDIKAFQPDLLLMDVMLGGLDGRAICRSIKENQATHLLPVILISGTHDLSGSIDLPGAPNDYIAKPYDLDHLLNTIQLQFEAKSV